MAFPLTPPFALCYYAEASWDRSSAWLERLPVKEKVGGSSPLGPANIRG